MLIQRSCLFFVDDWPKEHSDGCPSIQLSVQPARPSGWWKKKARQGGTRLHICLFIYQRSLHRLFVVVVWCMLCCISQLVWRLAEALNWWHDGKHATVETEKVFFRRLVFMFWSWIERVKKLSLQKSSTDSQTGFVTWFSTNCKSESPGQISNPSSWRLGWRVPAQSNCNIPSQPNLSTKWSHRADFTGVATSCKQLRRLAPVLAAVANWVRSFA